MARRHVSRSSAATMRSASVRGGAAVTARAARAADDTTRPALSTVNSGVACPSRVSVSDSGRVDDAAACAMGPGTWGEARIHVKVLWAKTGGVSKVGIVVAVVVVVVVVVVVAFEAACEERRQLRVGGIVHRDGDLHLRPVNVRRDAHPYVPRSKPVDLHLAVLVGQGPGNLRAVSTYVHRTQVKRDRPRPPC